MAFHFSLKSLLTLRLNEQRLCEQSLAIARQELAGLETALNRLKQQRMALVDEIRELNQGDALDVDRILNLQCHVDHLAEEIDRAQSSLQMATDHVTAMICHLRDANLKVQSLEKLEERKLADYRAGRLKLESQELDDLIATRSVG